MKGKPDLEAAGLTPLESEFVTQLGAWVKNYVKEGTLLYKDTPTRRWRLKLHYVGGPTLKDPATGLPFFELCHDEMTCEWYFCH